MNIDEDRARTEGNIREYKGKSYFFCSPECLADFDKDPERYLKSEPVQAKMEIPMTGSQGVPARHPTHDMAPKPPGAKKAPVAHDGMAMPGGETGAMPGMPAPRPKAEPEAGGATAPGSATSGPASMSLPMPQGAVPGMTQQRTLSGPGQGDMSMPPGAAPMPVSPGSAPMPGEKAGVMSPPMTGAPGMNLGPPAPSAPGSIPGPMPHETVIMPGAQSGEIAPPARATRTPRINPGSQRYRLPGTGPKVSPTPGSNVRGIIPPGATALPGVDSGSQPFPSPGSVLPPGPPEATSMPGMKAGEKSPPVSGPPEEKR